MDDLALPHGHSTNDTNSSIVNSFPSASQVVSPSDVEAEFVMAENQYLARKPQLPTPLCDHCQNIADNWDDFILGATLPHFSDEPSFLKSASTCSLCAQLLVNGSIVLSSPPRKDHSSVRDNSVAGTVNMWNAYLLLCIPFTENHQKHANVQQESLGSLKYLQYNCSWLDTTDPDQGVAISLQILIDYLLTTSQILLLLRQLARHKILEIACLELKNGLMNASPRILNGLCRQINPFQHVYFSWDPTTRNSVSPRTSKLTSLMLR